MKLVREHIFEAFTDESDPIKDLGIGIPAWEDLKKGAIIKCIKFTQFSDFWTANGVIKRTGETIYKKPREYRSGNLFEEGKYYRLLQDAEKREDGKIIIYAINIKHGNGSERLALTPKQLDNRFKIIKKGVNERMSFTEDGDPIKDMGIGDREIIILAKLNKLAKKHHFSKSQKLYINASDIESYGWENVKIIECWYKETKNNWIEVVLYSYIKDDDKNFGIWVTDEESESGGDEIDYPNDNVFTDNYWKNMIR